MPARKVRSRHDPALAQPHPDGTPVKVIQPIVHGTYGTLQYEYPYAYAQLYLAIAHNAAEEADDLFGKLIEKTPLSEANARLFPWDPETCYLQRFVQSGCNFILFSYLAVDVYTIQVFIGAANVGQTAKSDWSDVPIMDRLRSDLPKLFGCPKLEAQLMADYGEIGRVRDAIMHPKPANLYDASHTWDNVPLAWLLSERRDRYRQTARQVIEHFQPHYEAFLKEHARSVTFTGVLRGQRYTAPAKKRR